MNKALDHAAVKHCIELGLCVEKGKALSLCVINDYYRDYHKQRQDGYQVHCDAHNLRHSEIFKSLNRAVDKFLQLKNELQVNRKKK